MLDAVGFNVSMAVARCRNHNRIGLARRPRSVTRSCNIPSKMSNERSVSSHLNLLAIIPCRLNFIPRRRGCTSRWQCSPASLMNSSLSLMMRPTKHS